MRSTLVIGLTLMVAATEPALAQGPAVLGTCTVQQDGSMDAFATCPVTNTSSTPISTVVYGYRIVQEGRAEPLAEAGFGAQEGQYGAYIAEGLAPNATASVQFLVAGLPREANPALARYEIVVLGYRDATGAPIR